MINAQLLDMLSGYCEPLSYELSGNQLCLYNSDEKKNELTFLSETDLLIDEKIVNWQSLKLKDKVWLVSIPQAKMIYILDLAARKWFKVTGERNDGMESGSIGADKAWLPLTRSRFPLELLPGCSVTWHLSANAEVTQLFHTESEISIDGMIRQSRTRSKCISIDRDLCAFCFSGDANHVNYTVVMLCDFNAIRCIGGVISAETDNFLFSGYGRFD